MKKVEKVGIAAELLERLEAFTPKFHSGELRWQNYRLRRDKPMPVVFKVPLGQKLLAEAVYDVLIYNRRGQRAKAERDRPTVDHFEVRFYPQPDGSEVQAILHYAEYGMDEDLYFRDEKPLEVVWFRGPEKKGVLFFTPLGGNTEVRVAKEIREILFSGPAVVQITGSEESRYNCRKIVVEQGSEEAMVIYDHRKNRWSPFAMVEQVRKTCGKRSFEFWNLRDFLGDRNQIGHILTEQGLQEITEKR
jgi:hypothetical protein